MTSAGALCALYSKNEYARFVINFALASANATHKAEGLALSKRFRRAAREQAA